MGDERVSDHAAAPHDQVEHPGRDAAAVDDLGQRPGAGWNEVGRLEHDAVAEGQRGGDLPGRNGHGKVPRRDDADHAEGLARDFHADSGAHRGQRVARQPQAFAGEETEYVARAGDFGDGFGARLAFLARQQGAQFLLARQDLRADAVQGIAARLDAARGPCGESRLGGCHRRVELGCIGLRELADRVRGVGRVAVEPVPCAGHPRAGDEVFVRHVQLTGVRRGWPAKCRSAFSRKRTTEAWMACGEMPPMWGVSTAFSNPSRAAGGVGSFS